MEKTTVPPVEVRAVGIATRAHHSPGLGEAIEKAMADEVLACNAEGISTSPENSELIRGRMMDARERAKAAYAELVEKARIGELEEVKE